MRQIFKMCSLAFLIASVAMISALQLRADALHGVCDSPTPACSDNGTVTPIASNNPTYGFTTGSGATGDLLIVTLIPNNISGAATESFSVSGGATTPAVANLVGTTAWTTGKLDTVLSLAGGASPTNAIGAYLGTTQSLDSGATGYYVYEADLGMNTLLGNSATTATPMLNDGSFDLPNGASILAFLNEGTSASPNWIATSNSGQLSVDGPGPQSTTPEPASLFLLGTGLLALAVLVRRKQTAR